MAGASSLSRITHVHTIMRKIGSYLTVQEWAMLMAAMEGRVFWLFCCQTVQFRILKTRESPSDPDRCVTPFWQQRYFDFVTGELTENILVHQDKVSSTLDYVSGFVHRADIHSELCSCSNRFRRVRQAEVGWKRGWRFAKQTINVTVPNRLFDDEIVTI